jgi:hypothetical protein
MRPNISPLKVEWGSDQQKPFLKKTSSLHTYNSILFSIIASGSIYVSTTRNQNIQRHHLFLGISPFQQMGLAQTHTRTNKAWDLKNKSFNTITTYLQCFGLKLCTRSSLYTLYSLGSLHVIQHVHMKWSE